MVLALVVVAASIAADRPARGGSEASAAPAPGAPKDEAEPGPVIEVLLETEKTLFSTDDFVTMTATLKNVGNRDVVVDVARLGARGQYELMSSGSTEVLESGTWSPDDDKELKAHSVPLRAGRRISRFVNLTKHLGDLLRESGKMRVFLEFCDPALGGDASKPRCVTSNAVIIEIRKEATPFHR